MRIRSPLTESNLYGRRRLVRVSGSTGHSTKHLIRLIVLLALVLILMQRAGNPKVYQQLFSKLGIGRPVAATIVAESKTVPRVANSDMNRLVRFMTESQLLEMTHWLLDEQLIGPNSQFERRSDIDEPEDEMLADHQALVSDLIVAWQTKAPDNTFSEPVSLLLEQILLRKSLGENEQTILKLLATSLDQEILLRMDPNQLLKHGPIPYEKWLVTRGNSYWDSDSTEVGMLPLLQQAASYRTHWLQIRGQTVQADKIADFEQGTLYRLWLNPADGSKRPVVISTLDPPAVLIDATLRKSKALDIDVVAQGWFATSATYAAIGGVETTPVLIGNVALVREMATPPPEVTASDVQRQLTTIVLVLFVIIGFGSWRYYVWLKEKDRRDRLANAPKVVDLPKI